MDKKEKIITKYFNSWITGEISVLSETFDENAVYVESHGPLYRGIDSIIKWFDNWNEHGRVLKWEILQFIHNKDTVVCEWFFKCMYDEKMEEFNGVSLISFNKENKITLLKEFQSKFHNPELYR